MTETAQRATEFDIIDHNVIPDQYVTYTIDMWRGKYTDLATQITRYIGVFRAEDLENPEGEAFDPPFSDAVPHPESHSRYGSNYRSSVKPQPLVWAVVEVIRKAERDASEHAHEDEILHNPAAQWGSARREAELYKEFLDAIDRVAEDEEDQEAWDIIERWRNRLNSEYEK